MPVRAIEIGPFAGLPKPMGRPWTATEKDFLKANWRRPIGELAAMTGRSENAVYVRFLKMGIPRSSTRRLRFEPSFEEWHRAALDEARKAKVPLRLVISGNKLPAVPVEYGRICEEQRRACLERQKAIVARWKAWRRLKDNPRYSLAGIGRATGWHHTSIMHGLDRLKELELPSLVLRG